MKISIVTPSYQQGGFIEKTIQSVISQEDVPFDYVVMDGGSTDNTVAVLKQYQHCLTFISEKDGGQANAVNKGILQTTGDIIGWLNSDDIYYPGAIKKVCQYFADHPEVDVVYGQAHEIDRDGKIFAQYPTQAWHLGDLTLRCFISQPATFFRRRAVEQFGLIDEQLHFCMDYEFWLRLALKGAKFAYLPEVLAGTRIYEDTKSSRYFVEAHAEALTMLKKTLGYIPSDWIVNYSTACVKTNYGYRLPDPRFLFVTWLMLWKTSSMHYQGLSRITVWLRAQLAMMKKITRLVQLESVDH